MKIAILVSFLLFGTAVPSIGVEMIHEEKRDLSPALRTIPPKPVRAGIKKVVPNVAIWQEFDSDFPATGEFDPVVQNWTGGSNIPSPIQNFEGISAHGFIPPDTNGEAGLNHYVQMVNRAFAVFDKTGKVIYGPVSTNTIWTGFGGICETTNQGDPIVVYDQLADRWLLTQFANTGPGSHMECIAVSATEDPTGSYYRYSFVFPLFNDYPKFGVWPNGYYSTYILRNPDFGLVDSRICAFDRKKMLTGDAASAQCFDVGKSNLGLLPADLDGSTPPPAGSAHYSVRIAPNHLDLWKVKINWTNSSRSKITGPKRIRVAPYTPACHRIPRHTCVPQPRTKQALHAFSDRLMFRLSYRNFGRYESLVANHSVQTDQGISAIRWYEIRNPRRKLKLFQQGTFSPDNNHRWMGSVAMDLNGNIAVGYSVSGKKVYPGIRYTGRLATDPKGTLPQGEVIVMQGNGSQTKWNSWGDYSTMTIDPVDDCTFWYTSQYIPKMGNFNWRTRIVSFKFPSCGG